MKGSKIFLLIAGGIVIAFFTAEVTIWVQRGIHQKRMARRMPHLAGLLGKEKPKNLLETIKIVRITKELSLSEEQIAGILPKWNKLDEIKKAYYKERAAKLKELKQALNSAASEERLKDEIAELKELDSKFKIERKAIADDIDSILSTEQQAKLILFEQRFNCQMRKSLQKRPARKNFSRGRGPNKRPREAIRYGDQKKEAKPEAGAEPAPNHRAVF